MKPPMTSDTKLIKDEECESVDSTKYRGMIGSLLYLTVSRPDIMFSVCLCARFQEAPKTSYLEAVKRIFRYIKSTTHLGIRESCIRLDELAYGIPSDGPYQTNLPSFEDIILSIRIDQDGQVCRIRHEEEIDVLEYQVLTREIEPTLKPLKKLSGIVFWSGGLSGSCSYMENPKLDNESYVLYDRVMNPLAAQLERKPRRDRGTRRGRHSTSSSFVVDQYK
ncbi:hypothetical protein Tco_0060824 [Tanacetum coccineum]